MADDENFDVKLGTIYGRGSLRRQFKIRHRVVVAVKVARDGYTPSGVRKRFTGTHIGRGCGIGRVLASRDTPASIHQRHVIVKVRIIRLQGGGFRGAGDYLRYIERDGTALGAGKGALYGAEGDNVDRLAWMKQAAADRHQFRIILSVRDGLQYDDLKSLTRRFIARVEEDIDTTLDWCAADHYNTGHPHTHLIVRGKDDRGKDLVLAPDYITVGLRERVAELVDLDLGPHTDSVVEQRLRVEVNQERLTSIDEALVREADGHTLTLSGARNVFDYAVRMGRLQRLKRMGLANQLDETHWRLAPALETTLRQVSERGDAVEAYLGAHSRHDDGPALANLVIHSSAALDTQPVIGRVAGRLADGKKGSSRGVLIDATDGLSHYISTGEGGLEVPSKGVIVRVAPIERGVRDVDRTIFGVAATNQGRYTIDAHLHCHPSATQADAERHVSRLHAVASFTDELKREPDGEWVIGPGYLDCVTSFEAELAKLYPVSIDILSVHPLEKLVEAEAATWLDQELIAPSVGCVRDAGFGRELQDARRKRQLWLISEGFADEHDGHIAYAPDMIPMLERREFLHAADRLSQELKRGVRKVHEGDNVEGRLVRSISLMSGRFALIETPQAYTLVPWDPALDSRVGHPIRGIVHSDKIRWSFGRERE